MTEPGKGDRTEEHTKEQLDPQGLRSRRPCLSWPERAAKAPRCLWRGGVTHIASHVCPSSIVRVYSDENRRQDPQAVHCSKPVRALRHSVPFVASLITDGTATANQDQRTAPKNQPRPDSMSQPGQGHAPTRKNFFFSPVPYGTLCAFLPRQPASAEMKRMARLR